MLLGLIFNLWNTQSLCINICAIGFHMNIGKPHLWLWQWCIQEFFLHREEGEEKVKKTPFQSQIVEEIRAYFKAFF